MIRAVRLPALLALGVCVASATAADAMPDFKIGDWARYDLTTQMGDRPVQPSGRIDVTVVEAADEAFTLRIRTQRVNRRFGRPGGENNPQGAAANPVRVDERAVVVPRDKPYGFEGLLPNEFTREGVEKTEGLAAKAQLLVAGKAYDADVRTTIWKYTAPADQGKANPEADRRPRGFNIPALNGSLKIWTADDMAFGLLKYESSVAMANRGGRGGGQGGEQAASMEFKTILTLAATGDLAHPDPKAGETMEVPAAERLAPGGRERGGREGGGRPGGRGEGGGRPDRR